MKFDPYFSTCPKPKAFDKVWHKGLIFKLKQNEYQATFKVLSLTLQSNIEWGKPRGSILGPLLYLIYINDLSGGLTTNARLPVDDVLFFSVVDNINLSATNLNSDLSKISAWTNQWKVTFNPDPNKQARKIIFSGKIKKTSHLPLNFNNNCVKPVQFQKHLCVYLGSKLDFREHLQNMFKKVKNNQLVK